MILKIGYHGPDHIETWKYFEDFDDLSITSFLSNTHFYKKETQEIIYEPWEGAMAAVKDHEPKKIVTAGIQSMFHPDSCSVPETFVTIVYFLNLKTNTIERIACLSETVYVMNNNGKTVDKY